MFSKSFKLCPNKNSKKVKKTKIDPNGPLPDMRIADNNCIDVNT